MREGSKFCSRLYETVQIQIYKIYRSIHTNRTARVWTVGVNNPLQVNYADPRKFDLSFTYIELSLVLSIHLYDVNNVNVKQGTIRAHTKRIDMIFRTFEKYLPRDPIQKGR